MTNREVKAWHDRMDTAVAAERAKWEAEVKRLRAALEDRKRHGHCSSCGKLVFEGGSCTCGYEAARAALEEK